MSNRRLTNPGRPGSEVLPRPGPPDRTAGYTASSGAKNAANSSVAVSGSTFAT